LIQMGKTIHNITRNTAVLFYRTIAVLMRFKLLPSGLLL